MLIKLRKMMTNQKGFTLIELLVVIAIIGVLAAIAVPKMSGATASAKDGKLTADLRTIDGALGTYYANHDSKYPANLADLAPTTGIKLLAEIPKGAQGDTLVYSKVDASGATPASYTLSGVNSKGVATKSPGSEALPAAAAAD